MFKTETIAKARLSDLTKTQQQSTVNWGKVMLGTVLTMLTIGLIYGLQLGVY